MNGNTIDGSGLKCDGCDNALGASFFSCCVGECDYDLCLQCCRGAPATELPHSTTQRAERVNDREKPSEAPAVAEPRPKARRLPNKEAQKRAATASKKAQEKREKAQAQRKAAREKTHTQNRKPKAANKRPCDSDQQRQSKHRRGGL